MSLRADDTPEPPTTEEGNRSFERLRSVGLNPASRLRRAVGKFMLRSGEAEWNEIAKEMDLPILPNLDKDEEKGR
jgi:hypothetical protein